MAGNVQMITGGKHRRSRTVLLAAALVILVTGCGKKSGLEHAYSYEDRAARFTAEDGDDRAPGFAAGLAVPREGDDSPGEGEAALSARAAGVLSLDGGTALYQQALTERMNPASTTKVMTAIVALKYGNLSDLVTVPEEAVITESGSSMAGVVPGDQMSLEDLLYGLMIPSGNDAANAIAVHVGGSIEGFVSMMNQEAARLGATGTHFVNANGLTDPDHYTTAYDLYLMFHEALTYDTFRTIIGAHDHTAVYTGSDGSQKTASWTVGNYYMNGKAETPEGLAVFGGKTGTTKAAGYCLIMGTRTEDGREYASVIMGADSRAHLYEDMTNIISKIDK